MSKSILAIDIIKSGIDNGKTFAEGITDMTAHSAYDEIDREYTGEVQFLEFETHHASHFGTLSAAIANLFHGDDCDNELVRMGYELDDVVTGDVSVTIDYDKKKGYAILWGHGTDAGRWTTLECALTVEDWWEDANEE